MITLGDGSSRRAGEIGKGDVLLNPVTKRGVTVARVIEGPEAEPLVAIVAGGRTLRVSQMHVMKTKAGLLLARQVVVGDAIQIADGTFAAVEEVKLLEVAEGQKVVNFEFEGAHEDKNDLLVLSEGMVSGNLTLQNMAERGEVPLAR